VGQQDRCHIASMPARAHTLGTSWLLTLFHPSHITVQVKKRTMQQQVKAIVVRMHGHVATVPKVLAPCPYSTNHAATG
jgi:hypothetical protein